MGGYKMDIGVILICYVLLFVIIFTAVRLAISPLLNKQDGIIPASEDFGLVALRDIAILSNSELEEVIELYQNKGIKKKDCEQYQKYARVLKELKEMGYLSDELYFSKMNKLNNYFNAD